MVAIMAIYISRFNGFASKIKGGNSVRFTIWKCVLWILICIIFDSGAGIGGLTAAVVLCKSTDLEIDIYESSKMLNEVGAGVGMWKRTWNVMQALGLSDELTEMFGRVPSENPST